MNRFDILGVSHQKREPNDYYLLRENGQPAFNFIHFISPAIVIIDGAEIITQKDACIIYSPGYRQEYKAYNDFLINSYITFQVNDKDFIARFNLMENELFYVVDSDKITFIFEFLSWAVADKTEKHGEDITNGIYKLFETLSRLCVDNNVRQKRLLDTRQRFIALRDKMRADPSNWTIDKMAKSIWLTRSRFSVLYTQFFDISPNNDLMNIKIQFAKNLLETSNDSISSIAAKCGYGSVEYFIRLFNKVENVSPNQYRKLKRG